MSNITASLEKLQRIDGFVGAALVDSDSGMTLGVLGGNGMINLEVAAAGNTEVVRQKRKTMGNLNLRDEIEDILITLGKQYHLIRPMRARQGVFFYLALERSRANLALARMALADAEKDLQILSAKKSGTCRQGCCRQARHHARRPRRSRSRSLPDPPGRPHRLGGRHPARPSAPGATPSS